MLGHPRWTLHQFFFLWWQRRVCCVCWWVTRIVLISCLVSAPGSALFSGTWTVCLQFWVVSVVSAPPWWWCSPELFSFAKISFRHRSPPTYVSWECSCSCKSSYNPDTGPEHKFCSPSWSINPHVLIFSVLRSGSNFSVKYLKVRVRSQYIGLLAFIL